MVHKICRNTYEERVFEFTCSCYLALSTMSIIFPKVNAVGLDNFNNMFVLSHHIFSTIFLAGITLLTSKIFALSVPSFKVSIDINRC